MKAQLDTRPTVRSSSTEKQRKLAEDQLEQIKMLNSTCGGGKCTFLLGSGAVPTLSVK